MSLAKMLRMNQLFAFYQELLTDKQQQMLKLYYEEDHSLAEIADYFEVSRQAVHDNLKRGEKAIEDYEAKLKLNERRIKRTELHEALLAHINLNEESQQLIQALMEMDQ